MQSFNIVKEIDVSDSFRLKSLIGRFDLKPEMVKERFVGEINIPPDWNIGLIYGRSGTGKSTIARELFGIDNERAFEYKGKSVIDDFNKTKTVDEISAMLANVGFSSPPSWMKPYKVLSTGEKMRVDIARLLLEDKEIIVYDEYTSVVDRDVAKIGSLAVQKAIRRQKTKFIAVSCHKDIAKWLMPDWIYDTNTKETIIPKKKDHKSKLTYMKQPTGYGKCLGSITI